MDYDPAGSAAAVQKALTAHTGNKNNPHAVTAGAGGGSCKFRWSHVRGNQHEWSQDSQSGRSY